ncbi:uncharacterized protein LOC121621404 isoform X3 [Chelmon rostratus]|uniref:uncharacterized protein LOC121621404 isoform X3 n=1 Tax=Chelmon rostratus TaxID=109905 RepID=UPI001BEC07BA|nr:uncharacterized protein LOC121621404 isoform X3 [Chelmon rostratus]
MSIDGTKLLFEGFLQKRKDTMKIRWVTYWFRLQNTTLFFYTKKNGSASHLRGNYYIYTVQSVREVQKADSKRFMFEIIMTNGKRKLLAAETAALRQEWVGHLWQAMHLSASGIFEPRSTHFEVHEQLERINSSAPTCSHSNSVMELGPYRPLSAPTGHIQDETRIIASPVYQTEELNSEETMYQTTLPVYTCWHHKSDSLSSCQWSSGLSNAEGQEGDYDVLPVRQSQIQDETRIIASPVYQTEELNSEETMYQTTLPVYTCWHHKSDSLSSCQWSSGLSNAEGQEGDYDVLPVRQSQIQDETRIIASPVYQTEELNSDSLSSCQWSSGLSNAEGQEGDYDVLPVGQKICEINASTEMDEDMYDVPLSYRRAPEHPDRTDSIYDVPCSLLRTMSDHTEAQESSWTDSAGGHEVQFEDTCHMTHDRLEQQTPVIHQAQIPKTVSASHL